jgi:class 3 adenylate cyclase
MVRNAYDCTPLGNCWKQRDHKLIYSLRGNTTNVASRKESFSLSNKILAIEKIYDLLCHKSIFEEREQLM